MKATGKQWNDFLASWPDGWWYDDADVTVNGSAEGEEVKPGDRVELSCGVLFKGEGLDAPDADLVREFRKWIKAQNYEVVTLEVPRTVDHHHFAKRVHEMFGAKVVKP